MSTARILEAFNAAGAGKVSASAVRMRYNHSAGANMQVLEFDGVNGGTFVSEPFDPSVNPQTRAMELARWLSEAENSPANPQ